MLSAQDQCTAIPLFSTTRTAADPQSLTLMHYQAAQTDQGGNHAQTTDAYRTMIEQASQFSATHLEPPATELTHAEGDTAINALQHATAREPGSIDLHLRLGVALAHAGRLLEAQDAFCQVLDIDDRNLDAYLSLAQICRLGKHFREAVSLLEEAHRIHPNNADVVAALGLVAVDLGYRDGAMRLLGQLEALAPQHPERAILAQAVSAQALA